jgi:hypothetical protein
MSEIDSVNDGKTQAEAAEGNRKRQGREEGQALAEITEATNWQAHTVRRFVSILGGKGSNRPRTLQVERVFLLLPGGLLAYDETG